MPLNQSKFINIKLEIITGGKMPEVKVRIPPGVPEKIAKFELEREIEKKNRRFKSIKSSIEKLGLAEEDVEKFEEARKRAWDRRKEELL